MKAASLLLRLDRISKQYDKTATVKKFKILNLLERRRFQTVRQISRFHETLCFLRAYPDNKEILNQVEQILKDFALRSDLRRQRNALMNSGIAGTSIDFRFFWPMVCWLVDHWPQHLHLDWSEIGNTDKLVEILPLFLPFSERNQFDDIVYTAREWIERLQGPDETDAAFVIQRFTKIYKNSFEREALHDGLDLAYRLKPGPGTPSSTHLKYSSVPVVFQKTPLQRKRPNVRNVIKHQAYTVRYLSPAEGEKLIDLARATMVTNERDLDAFSYGDKNDVRLFDMGDGLQLACIGTIPERRYLMPVIYGFLNLKNGVPIGYYQISALLHTAELAFTIFESYRGSEAAVYFTKALAVSYQLFGIESFVLDPYQLGHKTEDGLKSGVWWFYYKLGFRPRAREIRQILRDELAQMKHDSKQRSSRTTLNKLSADNMYFELNPRNKNKSILPLLYNISPGISLYLAKQFGSNREAAIRSCSQQAAKKLGLRSLHGFTQHERQAWERWSPLIINLPGIDRWNVTDRKALIKIVRAKGGRRESDFLKLFDRHKRLQRALLKFAEQADI